MPSRKEIQWSQLKVGLLVLSATAVLIALIFLMNSSTGGLFGHKRVLRAYFANASGLKVGAVVSLDGVTVGNVTKILVVPARNPNPVEVTMHVGEKFWPLLHTDSVARITPAGVLGESFVDIDSRSASGPPPADNAEIAISNSPTIAQVVATSQTSIEAINRLLLKIDTLIDSMNSTRGAFGEIVNDPALKKKVLTIASNLQTVTAAFADNKGSLGKLVNDDTLYTKLNSTVDRLNSIVTRIDSGKGTAGKLLVDDTLYNNLDSAASNLNQVLAGVNSGQGAIGKLAKDPVLAQQLGDAIANLDGILKTIDSGQGTMGQLVQNRSLYDHADQTMDEAHQLIQGIRKDPKKYLVIRMKLF